jgi:hypothetical protein
MYANLKSNHNFTWTDALRGKDVYRSHIKILCENETDEAQEGFLLVKHIHERSTCRSLPQSTGSLITNTPLTSSE